MSEILRRLIAFVSRRLPPERSEWGVALVREADEIEEAGELASWTLGAAGFVARVRLAQLAPPPSLLGALIAAGAGLAWFDFHTEATQTSLVALLIASGAAGALVPQGARASGLLLGSAIAFGHLAMILSGRGVPRGHPHSAGSASLLFLLALPALGAALLGARLRRPA